VNQITKQEFEASLLAKAAYADLKAGIKEDDASEAKR
jgi:hypothetical protein